MQNVCFTSILDEEARRKAGGEIMRVLKPGGIMLWYDFRYNNPRNKQVRAVTTRQIRTYFPGMRLKSRSILLHPWIARMMVSSFWRAGYYLLYMIPFLRTHVFSEITWPNGRKPNSRREGTQHA